MTSYLERVAVALKKANMVIDVNTGTLYRYPVKEISPYADFEEAIDYVRGFGYKKVVRFDKRYRSSQFLIPNS